MAFSKRSSYTWISWDSCPLPHILYLHCWEHSRIPLNLLLRAGGLGYHIPWRRILEACDSISFQGRWASHLIEKRRLPLHVARRAHSKWNWVTIEVTLEVNGYSSSAKTFFFLITGLISLLLKNKGFICTSRKHWKSVFSYWWHLLHFNFFERHRIQKLIKIIVAFHVCGTLAPTDCCFTISCSAILLCVFQW